MAMPRGFKYYAMAGLAALAGVFLPGGCPSFVQVTGENVPHRNSIFGQQEELCEDTLDVDPTLREPAENFDENLQASPRFTYNFNGPIGEVDVKFQTDPQIPDEPQPVTSDWLVRKLDDGARRLEVYVWDNPAVDGNGNVWTLEGKVHSPTGELMMPIDGSGWAEPPLGHSFLLHYTVTSDCDLSGLEDRVNQNTTAIGNLRDDLDTHTSQTVPPAHSGGQNGGGEELGPIPDSLWEQASVKFYDGNTLLNPQNDPNYVFAMNPASVEHLNARFVASSELEAALNARNIAIPQPTVRDTGYNFDSPLYDPNNPDCFRVENVGALAVTTTSEGAQGRVNFDLVQDGCVASLYQDTETVNATFYFVKEDKFYAEQLTASTPTSSN